MRVVILHNEGPENDSWNYKHTDISLDNLFETANLVVKIHESDDSKTKMAKLLETYKNTDVNLYVFTDIYCDFAEGPCGCYGFSGSCEYHVRGGVYCNDEFADCLCSSKHGIVCEYHK